MADHLLSEDRGREQGFFCDFRGIELALHEQRAAQGQQGAP